MKEIWKDIEDFPGYQISNLGNVKSFKGKIPLIMSPSIKKRGNKQFCLMAQDKTRPTRTAHRLVMEAFVGKSELEIDHINGNPSDNCIVNLRYVTRVENTQNRIRLGRSFNGVQPWRINQRLTPLKVRLIRYKFYKKNKTQRLIAKEIGVSFQHISRVILKQEWGHCV